MGRLSGLDALRGIAALLVALCHASSIAKETQLEFPALRWFDRSYLAVDLFFVISGYVMARTYEGRFPNLTPPQFLKLRWLRLAPIMGVGAIFGLMLNWGEWPPATTAVFFFYGLTLMPVLSPGVALYPINGPAWSILYELIGNFAHALVLHRLSARALAIICGISAVLLVTYSTDARTGPDSDTFLITLPRLLFSYCAGLILWRTLGNRTVLPWWLGLAAFPALAIGVTMLGGRADFAVIALCPLIVASALSPAPRWLAAFGALSFPLYAIHYPIEKLAIRSGLHPLTGLVFAIVIAVGIAAIERAASRRRRTTISTASRNMVAASPIDTAAQNRSASNQAF